MRVAAAGPARPLSSIFAGSWINADFGIWIGHRDDRRAWELLGEARARYAGRHRCRRPKPGARPWTRCSRPRAATGAGGTATTTRRRTTASSTRCSGATSAASTRRSPNRSLRPCTASVITTSGRARRPAAARAGRRRRSTRLVLHRGRRGHPGAVGRRMHRASAGPVADARIGPDPGRPGRGRRDDGRCRRHRDPGGAALGAARRLGEWPVTGVVRLPWAAHRRRAWRPGPPARRRSRPARADRARPCRPTASTGIARSARRPTSTGGAGGPDRPDPRAGDPQTINSRFRPQFYKV